MPVTGSKLGQSIYCAITLATFQFNCDECHCSRNKYWLEHVLTKRSVCIFRASLIRHWEIMYRYYLKNNEGVVCNYKLTRSVFLCRLQSPPQPTPFRRRAVGLRVVVKMVVIIVRRTVRATAPVAQLSPDWLVVHVCVARTRTFLIHRWFGLIHISMHSKCQQRTTLVSLKTHTDI